MKDNYKKYNLLLDKNDPDEKLLIDYLESKHTSKHKNSYSEILRQALKLLVEKDYTFSPKISEKKLFQ